MLGMPVKTGIPCQSETPSLLTLPAITDGGSSFIHETCPSVWQLKGRGPHVQKRSQGLLPVGSCVPHGTDETERVSRCKTPSGREASMRSRDARFYAGSCTVSWSTRSCFYQLSLRQRTPQNAIWRSRYANKDTRKEAHCQLTISL